MMDSSPTPLNSAETPGAGGSRPWPPAARWAMGCGLGCVGLILLEGVVFWALFSMTLRTQPPEGLQARLEHPRSVVAGRGFPATLVVRNRGARPLPVRGIVFRRESPGVPELRNPRPAPEATVSTPALFGVVPPTVIWSFRETVPPGGAWRVRFDAVAPRAGTHRGALEVQAGGASREISFEVTVRAAGSPAPEDPAPARPARP